MTKDPFDRPRLLRTTPGDFHDSVRVIYRLVQERLIEQLRSNLKGVARMRQRRAIARGVRELLDPHVVEASLLHDLPSQLPDIMGIRPRPDPGDLPRKKGGVTKRCAHTVWPWRWSTEMMMIFLSRYARSNDAGEVVCRSCETTIGGVLMSMDDNLIQDESSGPGGLITTRIAGNKPIQLLREFQVSKGLADDLLRLLQHRVARSIGLTRLTGDEKNSQLSRDQVVREVIELATSWTEETVHPECVLLVPPIVDQDLGTLRHEPTAFNTIIMFTVFVLLTDLSMTEADHVINANIRACPVSFFSKNRKFFDGYTDPWGGSGSIAAKYPMLCTLIAQTCCLFYHYSIILDPEKDRARSIKSMIITQIELFQGLVRAARRAKAPVIVRVIEARARLMRGRLYGLVVEKKKTRAVTGEKRPPAAAAFDKRVDRYRARGTAAAVVAAAAPTTTTALLPCPHPPGYLHLQPRAVVPFEEPPRAEVTARAAIETVKLLMAEFPEDATTIRVYVDASATPLADPVVIPWNKVQKRDADQHFDRQPTLTIPLKKDRVVYHGVYRHYLGYMSHGGPIRYTGKPIYAVVQPPIGDRIMRLLANDEPSPAAVAAYVPPDFPGESVQERMLRKVPKDILERARSRVRADMSRERSREAEETARRFAVMIQRAGGKALLPPPGGGGPAIVQWLCKSGKQFLQANPDQRKNVMRFLEEALPQPTVPDPLFYRLMSVQRYQRPVIELHTEVAATEDDEQQQDDDDTSAFQKLRDMDTERPIYDDDDDNGS